MAKWIKFVDTAGSDEHLVAAHRVSSIYVTAATTVIVYFFGIDSDNGTTLSFVTLTTVSGKSDEVAENIAKRLATGRGALYSVTTDDRNITTVAFTEGS
jgi:hypothetical protein